LIHLKLLLSLLLLTSITNSSLAAPTIRVGISGFTKENRTFRVAQRIADEIGLRMQRSIVVESLPAYRAAAMLKRGSIHAEMSRVAAYKDLAPNAIQLKPIIKSHPLYVYSKKHQFNVKGWGSLRPYTVLTINGWIFIKKYLSQYNVKTISADSPKDAVRLLQASRADLLVMSRFSAEGAFKEISGANSKIHRLEPPVAHQKSYTFFSGHYPALAAEYERHLEAIKNEGLLTKLMRETL
jgi:polar amino acid transport system substrate-binding protein